MAFCEKCGANLADGTKFCDKCGAPTNVAASAAPSAPAYGSAPATPSAPAYGSAPSTPAYGGAPMGYVPVMPVAPKKPIDEKLIGLIPEQMRNAGNKIWFWIGWGSTLALALTYIITMFMFMDEMCYVVARGANEVWMIFYFLFSLFPVYFAVTAVTKGGKYKLFASFMGAFSLTLTFFALICWGIMDGGRSLNTVAYYGLMDTMSELWYLKILIAPAVFVGFIADYLINKTK